jgi:hypothetical protein
MKKCSLFCAVFLLSFLTGCAVFNEDNRRVLNKLDEWIQPETTGARVALAPAAVPLGTVAGAADMVLVHPLSVIPDAADDVYELYWKPREMDFLRQSLLIPLFVVLTPPTFVGDWLFRSLFDVQW